MSNKKVCVVGAGYWGKNHIRTLNDLDALGGIVEENKNLLDQISEQYPDAKTYQNLNEALVNEEFTGFTVATPAGTHHNIAVQIIKSGKHVLVEKPLCLNIKDAENNKFENLKSFLNLIKNPYDSNNIPDNLKKPATNEEKVFQTFCGT